MTELNGQCESSENYEDPFVTGMVGAALDDDHQWMGEEIYWRIRKRSQSVAQDVNNNFMGDRNSPEYLADHSAGIMIDTTLKRVHLQEGIVGVRRELRCNPALEVGLTTIASRNYYHLHGDAAGAAALLASTPSTHQDLVPGWARAKALEVSRDLYREDERRVDGWSSGGLYNPGGLFGATNTRQRRQSGNPQNPTKDPKPPEKPKPPLKK